MDGYIYATYADGNRLQLNGGLFLRWKWRKVENHFFGIPWTLSQAVKVGMFPSQFCLLGLQMTTAMMDDNDNNEDVDNNNDDDLNHLTTDGRGSRHGGGSKVWTRSANKQLEVIARRQLTIQIQRWRKCSKINFFIGCKHHKVTLIYKHHKTIRVYPIQRCTLMCRLTHCQFRRCRDLLTFLVHAQPDWQFENMLARP